MEEILNFCPLSLNYYFIQVQLFALVILEREMKIEEESYRVRDEIGGDKGGER